MEPDPDVARVLVTAHGWACVQRIVVLLGSRGYVVISFQASPSTCAPFWQVCVVVRCSPSELLLLEARLQRIPSVTSVLSSPLTSGCGVLVPPAWAAGPEALEVRT